MKRITVCVPRRDECKECVNYEPPKVIQEETRAILQKGGSNVYVQISEHPPLCPHCNGDIGAGENYFDLPTLGVMCEDCVMGYERTFPIA
jgi:hypothetical protein